MEIKNKETFKPVIKKTLYKCDKCGKEIINKQNYDLHVKNKVCQKIPVEFKCEKCNKIFREKRSLIYHNEHNVCDKKLNSEDENDDLIKPQTIDKFIKKQMKRQIEKQIKNQINDKIEELIKIPINEVDQELNIQPKPVQEPNNKLPKKQRFQSQLREKFGINGLVLTLDKLNVYVVK